MTANGWLQFFIFIGLLLALMRPLGLVEVSRTGVLSIERGEEVL